MIQRIRQVLVGALQRVTVQQVLTLVTGTVIAQAFSLLLMIPLARLYTPSDFGNFAIYQSIASVLVTISALRYDLAVMLPESDEEAKTTKSLATNCIVTTSIITSLVGLVIAVSMPHGFSSSLQRWMPVLGLTVFLTAETNNLQYWLNRHSRYKAISINRVVQVIATSFSQLITVLIINKTRLVNGTDGLIFGSLFGLLAGYLFVCYQTRDLRQLKSSPNLSKLAIARRYRKMPLINGPNVLIDGIRINGINLLVAAVAVSSLGQFNLAWKTIQAPASLIQGAIAQVFFRRLSTAQHGTMTPLVKKTLKTIALLGIPTFLLLAILVPWLIPFVFGPSWIEAGLIAQALCPWIFTNILSSPISNVFIVTNTQGRLLVFATVFCIVPLTFLWLTPWSLVTSVWILSLMMSLMLFTLIIMALHVAKNYDSSDNGMKLQK